MGEVQYFDAEYRNIVGPKVPTTIDKCWGTLFRCKVCKRKMLSNGEVMWCEMCYEKMIQDTINSIKIEHDRRLVYAFYYGSTPNMMALIGMTIFKLAYYIKQMREEEGYDIPTREEIKKRLVIKIN